ncbi:class A sortase [Peptostreptococcus canis]|uniref:Class A sortase n=1 Tax=Peptostreptococcus canis TaxID=1159213 RepID=A0ABR6TJV1_9FIRM|nr:class A sortase [Peptostreptococcus canis]MBC2575677.1 class A sortase [Peptostreptococcus canis]MBP1997118.1 sortase A [Peptostreptococcus canis]
MTNNNDNNSRSENQINGEKKRKPRIRLIIASLLLIISAILFSIKPIENKILSKNIQEYNNNRNKIMSEVAKKSKTEKNKKKKKKAEYDFDKVKELKLSTIKNSKNKVDFSYADGAISIPSINMSIPIFIGLNNYNLTYGAGTMKEDQIMGERNYALAGHNYPKNPKILFSPLKNISDGDQIFITDFRYIYVYNCTGLYMIDPSQTNVIEDDENKKEITLITCNNSGSKRFAVKGDFIYKVPVDQADNNIKNTFGFKF